LQNERVDECPRNANSAMRGQRSAQHLQIAKKILDRTVCRKHLCQLFVSARQRERRHGHSSTEATKALPGKVQRALNARLHADDEPPIVFELILLAEDLRLRRMHLRNVSLQ